MQWKLFASNLKVGESIDAPECYSELYFIIMDSSYNKFASLVPPGVNGYIVTGANANGSNLVALNDNKIEFYRSSTGSSQGIPILDVFYK